MTKTFTTLEIINICAWYKQSRENPDKPLSVLPLTVQWKLKNNVTKLQTLSDNFMNFRDEADNAIREEYISDEKSEESVDEQGQPIRKIKDEYLETYQAKVTELNEKLSEIIAEKQDVDIDTIDINAVVDEIVDNSKLTIEDLEMLNFMNID